MIAYKCCKKGLVLTSVYVIWSISESATGKNKVTVSSQLEGEVADK